MDGSRFDAWTRRRFSVATGGLVAVLCLDLARNGAAGKRKKRHKRKKRRCGKHKRLCQDACIKRSQCCSDGDCPGDAKCCSGDCVSLDRPCELDGLYACFSQEDGGVLRQAVEGDVYCTRTSDLPVCAQCEGSEGCLEDERCFPAHCADEVTSVCRKVYVEF